MSIAKEYFDKAIQMEPGQRMVIPCYDRKHMLSLRVMLGRERNLFVTATSPDFDIIISTESLQDRFAIIISKTPPIQAPFIIDKNGVPLQKLIVKQKQVIQESSAAEPPDRERQIRIMKEDGMTDDEIKEYFAEHPADDLSA